MLLLYTIAIEKTVTLGYNTITRSNKIDQHNERTGTQHETHNHNERDSGQDQQRRYNIHEKRQFPSRL